MKSKYEHKINVIVSEGIFQLHGDRLLVEILSEEEKKTSSGIILQEQKKNPLMNESLALVKVLAAGEGYYTENEGKVEFVPLKNKPGDYVMVSTMGLVPFKDFFLLSNYKENTLGLVGQENVHSTISNLEQFLQILKS